MSRLRSCCLAGFLAVCALAQPFAQSALPPSAEEQQIYMAFRTWMSGNPDSMKGDVEANYRAELKKQGVAAAEIDRRLKIINDAGSRAEARCGIACSPRRSRDSTRSRTRSLRKWFAASNPAPPITSARR